jgi:mono/diheme cytochrome c family protein
MPRAISALSGAAFPIVLALSLVAAATGQEDADGLLPGIELEERIDDLPAVRSVVFDLSGGRLPFAESSGRTLRRRFSGWWLGDGRGEHRWYVAGPSYVALSIDRQPIDATVDADAGIVTFGPIVATGDWQSFELVVETTEKASPRETSPLQLSWSGPGFGAEPLPLHRLRRDVDPELDRLERGRELLTERRCARCHVELGSDLGPAAPDLRTSTRGTIRARLARHPRLDDPSAEERSRAMPRFALTDSESDDLTNYLIDRQRGHTIRAVPPLPPGDAMRGDALLVSVGCLACHDWRDSFAADDDAFRGPRLDRVASYRSRDAIVARLIDPRSLDSNARMPRVPLDEQEIADLVAALVERAQLSENETGELRSVDEPPSSIGGDSPARTESIRRGELLYRERRCVVCHDSPDEQVAPAVALPIGSAGLGCADRSPDFVGVAPIYPLDADDRSALKAAIAEARAQVAMPLRPIGSAESLSARHRCLACHERGGRSSRLPESIVAASDDDRTLEPGRIRAPSLDGIGDRLRPDVLHAALRDGSRRREWLSVRMPIFDLDDEARATIVDHLRAVDRLPAALAEATRTADPDEIAIHGPRLVGANGFGCTSCHAIGRHRPVGVLPHALGPPLDDPASRFERDWFDRWLRDPARIVPDMEMPSVRIPVDGPMHGDLALQIDALWQTLSTDGFDPPRADPERVLAHDGRTADARALLVRDVVRDADRTYVSPLLIGLANRHALLFDFERSGLVRWWIGDAARQYTEGKSWYWEPGGVPLATAESAATAELSLVQEDRRLLPQRTGQFVATPDGWSHDAPAVEFGYSLSFADETSSIELRVVERWEPTGHSPDDDESGLDGAGHAASTGLRRTLRVDGIPGGWTIRFDSLLIGGSVSEDRSSLVFGQPRRRIRLVDPMTYRRTASPTFEATGSLHLDHEHGSVSWQLDYLTDLSIDRGLELADEPANEGDASETPNLDAVPGFRAMRIVDSADWMPTGIAWDPHGRLFVTSLDGRIGRVDFDRSPDRGSIRDLGETLAAPFGLYAGNRFLDVIHKSELLRLHDDDDDGTIDRVRRLASGWGHTADYHDWAVGLARDEEGAYWIALPCQQDDRSAEASRLRGTVVRLVPESSEPESLYRVDPISAGHRFPIGIVRTRSGQVLVTDNQGNFNPFNELNRVERGLRYGFPNAWERKQGLSFPETPPSIAIPHPWTRSVNGIAVLERDGLDDAKAFGPFAGDVIGCEYDTRRLVRMSLDEVDGTLQGAVYPFSRDDERSGALLQGPLSCGVSPEGDLVIGTIRDSGWGGAGNVGGLVRLSFRPESMPTGIAKVRATARGFRVEFTRPIASERLAALFADSLRSFRRESTPAYGGPDLDQRSEPIADIEPSDGGRSVELRLERAPRAGFVYRLSLDGSAIEEPLFPAEAYYTMNRVPRH